ncbi:MAG: tyrosine-type recombinase/integrase [Pyrinomonadaceae bacterium]|nr:tyrosine-type recombinase/integrase [Pyrinomonadaceae bacterium]
MLEVLTGRRAHLRPQVTVSIGTGLRKREMLNLRREHADLSRDLIVVTHTKSRRNREVPMNDQVCEVIVELCNGRRPWITCLPIPGLGSLSQTASTRLPRPVVMPASRAYGGMIFGLPSALVWGRRDSA